MHSSADAHKISTCCESKYIGFYETARHLQIVFCNCNINIRTKWIVWLSLTQIGSMANTFLSSTQSKVMLTIHVNVFQRSQWYCRVHFTL